MVVTAADDIPVAVRVPGRSDDACAPRDHLPGAVCAGRGEPRRELPRCLRTARVRRRTRGCGENTGQIRGRVISDRPGEAADRAVPRTLPTQAAFVAELGRLVRASSAAGCARFLFRRRSFSFSASAASRAGRSGFLSGNGALAAASRAWRHSEIVEV